VSLKRHAPILLVLLAALWLDARGVRFGLPSVYTWVPDEIIPAQVLEGLEQRFSNGWWNPYPPLHFYLMAASYAPTLLKAHGRVAVTGTSADYETLFVSGRLLSVAMGGGTVLLLYLCGLELGLGGAAAAGALSVALSPTLVYYSKFANFDVPYCFWFALALLFFLRLLREPRGRDVLAYSLASMAAIVTKDQAYALFVLPWIAVAFRIWRSRREAKDASPFRALLDRRLLTAALGSVLLFVLAQNLPFNLSGFRAHVANITGPLGADYRMFDGSLRGRLGMLVLSARHVAFVLGWPAALLAVLGLGLALRAPRRERRLIAALLPAASYQLFFSQVVLYSYDRFELPGALVLALFVGRAFAETERLGASRVVLRPLALGALVAWGLLRAVSVDLVIDHDSRYAVEAWLRRNVDRGAKVALLGPLEYLPRMAGLTWKQRTELIRSVEHYAPAYVVVNADYAARAEDPHARELYARLADGELGYTLALRQRSPVPWPYRIDERLRARARAGSVYSNLEKLDPEIRVYRRRSVP
jgi:hypothetical protein